jgi:hypothetical protein
VSLSSEDVLGSTNWAARLNLKYAEQFEHDYDNDNYSNYVKDVSVHTGDSYQSEGAMARIYWNEPGSFVDPRGRFGRDLVNSSCASIFCRPNTKNFNLHAAEHLFALLRSRVVGKTSLLSNLGSPFEDEETNPKHQHGSIRVASSQKGHDGSHNSGPKACKRRERWQAYCRRIQTRNA